MVKSHLFVTLLTTCVRSERSVCQDVARSNAVVDEETWTVRQSQGSRVESVDEWLQKRSQSKKFFPKEQRALEIMFFTGTLPWWFTVVSVRASSSATVEFAKRTSFHLLVLVLCRLFVCSFKG